MSAAAGSSDVWVLMCDAALTHRASTGHSVDVLRELDGLGIARVCRDCDWIARRPGYEWLRQERPFEEGVAPAESSPDPSAVEEDQQP